MSTKRPMTPRDLARFRLLEDHALSPDEKLVAFTVATIEGDDWRYRGAIWLQPTDGGEARQVTRGAKGDGKPTWRPDGEAIAFLSDRGSGPQVHVLELSGGDARPVTSFAAGVGGFDWSPSGAELVVSSAGDATREAPETRRITRLHYKGDGVGLLGNDRAHLWLVNADGGGAPRQLTRGDEDDLNPVFSPDGGKIAFNRTRPSVGGTAPFMDVLVHDVASGDEVNLTNGRGPCFSPTWSPDGTTIAFAGHTEPMDIWWGANFGIWTAPAGGGDFTELTAGFSEMAARAVFGDPWRGLPWPNAQWSADGSKLFFLATIGGTCQVCVVSRSGGDARPITSGRHVVTDLHVSGDAMVYGAMTSTTPTDLWFAASSTAPPRRLTDLNAALRDETSINGAEPIRFTSWDGTEIEAWLIPPLGFDPSGDSTHPLVMTIHGGPHGAYGEAFHHSFQTFAGHGWFSLYVNPRGSQGYGEAFALSCIGDWGGGDFLDLMAAVDHVVARGRVDSTKLGAWGASYGGYMTTWISGNTDRFAAIVSVVPVTDLISFHGTSDIGHYFTPFEMGCQPWEDRERYVRMSPLTYAANVTTPLLLVHHEQDLRCPIAQSEQYYTTLKSMGKTVELLRINDASHGIVPPARAHHEIIGLEAAVEWFEKHF